MAYQDRFENWASSGVKVVPVLSQPDDAWTGEQGYFHAAFARDTNIFTHQSIGAVLYGQKQMAELNGRELSILPSDYRQGGTQQPRLPDQKLLGTDFPTDRSLSVCPLIKVTMFGSLGVYLGLGHRILNFIKEGLLGNWR
ncbi:hypothetical protein HAX54_042328 [Datura stramonium]|uniref:Uncharacterized protein n=1 Tax=Datura stramonium TaxID=4076 RepID=A0ABS8W0Y8_DATST|nr:hypothetical protein [Datura stramonium]